MKAKQEYIKAKLDPNKSKQQKHDQIPQNQLVFFVGYKEYATNAYSGYENVRSDKSPQYKVRNAELREQSGFLDVAK